MTEVTVDPQALVQAAVDFAANMEAVEARIAPHPPIPTGSDPCSAAAAAAMADWPAITEAMDAQRRAAAASMVRSMVTTAVDHGYVDDDNAEFVAAVLAAGQ